MATLRVFEVFDSLQGEGYWIGTPMTFVRLAGCNAPLLALGCTRWCDTREAWDPDAGYEMEVAEIVEAAALPCLCLTGGEPLLQIEGVRQLLAAAHTDGRRVHVETNGTVDPPDETKDCFDWATVSPKPPRYSIAPGWRGRVDELKLVVDEELDTATAERLAAAHPEAVISIQPRWAVEFRALPASATGAGDALNRRAIALVMQHPGWRLSLQMHKLLGIR